MTAKNITVGAGVAKDSPTPAVWLLTVTMKLVVENMKNGQIH